MFLNITGEIKKAPARGALRSFSGLPPPALPGSGCQGYHLSFLHFSNADFLAPLPEKDCENIC
jgi:hypothetical protein